MLLDWLGASIIITDRFSHTMLDKVLDSEQGSREEAGTDMEKFTLPP